MRQRKLDLPARVNGDLRLKFSDIALTSYAGLELFGRYRRHGVTLLTLRPPLGVVYGLRTACVLCTKHRDELLQRRKTRG